MYQAKGRDFILRLGTDICILVSKERRRHDALQLSAERGWPINSIDFKRIPSRVCAMFEELDRLIFDRDAQESQHVWTDFDGDLEGDGWTIKTFARAPLSKISSNSMTARNARPG